MKKLRKQMVILFCITALVLPMLAGCNSNSGREVVVTVDGRKVYMDEAIYLINDTELYWNQMDQLYLQLTGKSCWEEVIDEATGMTRRAFLKQNVMDSLILNALCQEKAEAAGITLTENEIKTQEESAKQFMSDHSEEELKLLNTSEETIAEYLKSIYLTSKYMQDYISKMKLNDDKLKEITPEKYRQYNTKQIVISKQKFDENGSVIKMSAKEKKAALKKAEKALAKAKVEKDFDKLVTEYSEDEASETGGAFNFTLVGDEVPAKEITDVVTKLKNGKISNIIETEDAYYIFKMIDNNSPEAYNEEIDVAKQTQFFQEDYQKMKDDAKVEINNKLWDSLVMGEISIVPASETPQDEEETVPEDEGTTAE